MTRGHPRHRGRVRPAGRRRPRRSSAGRLPAGGPGLDSPAVDGGPRPGRRRHRSRRLYPRHRRVRPGPGARPAVGSARTGSAGEWGRRSCTPYSAPPTRSGSRWSRCSGPPGTTRDFGFRLASEYGITPSAPGMGTALPGSRPDRLRPGRTRRVRLPQAVRPRMTALERPPDEVFCLTCGPGAVLAPGSASTSTPGTQHHDPCQPGSIAAGRRIPRVRASVRSVGAGTSTGHRPGARRRRGLRIDQCPTSPPLKALGSGYSARPSAAGGLVLALAARPHHRVRARDRLGDRRAGDVLRRGVRHHRRAPLAGRGQARDAVDDRQHGHRRPRMGGLRACSPGSAGGRSRPTCSPSGPENRGSPR